MANKMVETNTGRLSTDDTNFLVSIGGKSSFIAYQKVTTIPNIINIAPQADTGTKYFSLLPIPKGSKGMATIKIYHLIAISVSK